MGESWRKRRAYPREGEVILDYISHCSLWSQFSSHIINTRLGRQLPHCSTDTTMSEPAVIVTFVGTDLININGVLIVFTRSGMESPPIIWQVHCKDRESH
jgi:hypothetical protein